MNFRTALAVLGAALITPLLGSAQLLRSNVSTPVVSNQSTSAPDVFRVQYFRGLMVGATLTANANGTFSPTGWTEPSEFVDVVNPGTNGADPNSERNGIGDLCAAVYVVDTFEELEECCSCLVTPDQLIEFNVQANLLANPNNPRILHNGTIKIISEAPGSGLACNAATGTPTPTLREWITHIRAYNATTTGAVGLGGTAAIAPTLGVTEEEFSFAPLSASEQSFLQNQCSVIQQQSTGAGICSCPAQLP